MIDSLTAHTSKAIYQSLIESPLLIGDLPEAPSFPRGELLLPRELPPLNLQQKLGHLYEDALASLLESSPRFDLLARNLQIQKDAHTTVGELDFLLRDLESGQLIHLELATKFYLAVEAETGLTLPGPDARDNYFKKLQRLRSHQLQLPSLYQVHFPEAYRHEPIITQQLIYGCLFDHIHAAQLATPEFSHPNGRRGRWLTIDELPDHFPPETIFQIIPKPLWPVPFEFLNEIVLDNWSPNAAVDRCLMFRVVGKSVRYFVAPSGYPKTVSSSPLLFLTED